jgi:hypothetical protein
LSDEDERPEPDEEEEPIDPLPGLIASIDQMIQMSGQMARVVRAEYLAYLDEDFTHKEALYLAACRIRSPEVPDE